MKNKVKSKGFFLNFLLNALICYLSSLSVTYFMFHDSPLESLIENVTIAVIVSFIITLYFYKPTKENEERK